MLKQRKDSLEIYRAQNRDDLAKKEEEEIAIIEKFLPKQMSDDCAVGSKTSASHVKDLAGFHSRAIRMNYQLLLSPRHRTRRQKYCGCLQNRKPDSMRIAMAWIAI